MRCTRRADRGRSDLGETPTPTELLEAVRARPGFDWLKSTRRLAGLLNPLGIVRQQVRAGDRRRWCYVLLADQLADLRAQYGGATDASEEADAASPSTGLSPLSPVSARKSGKPRLPMGDLTPRIDKLVGSLSAGRPGEQAPGRVTVRWPSLRAGDPGFAEALARLVAMPLNQFARDGQLLEIRIPWLNVTLWFVPDERDVDSLIRAGVARGRVWTAQDLSAVVTGRPESRGRGRCGHRESRFRGRGRWRQIRVDGVRTAGGPHGIEC